MFRDPGMFTRGNIIGQSSYICPGIIALRWANHIDIFILILEKLNIRQPHAGKESNIQTIFLTWFTLAAKNLNPHK